MSNSNARKELNHGDFYIFKDVFFYTHRGEVDILTNSFMNEWYNDLTGIIWVYFFLIYNYESIFPLNIYVWKQLHVFFTKSNTYKKEYPEPEVKFINVISLQLHCNLLQVKSSFCLDSDPIDSFES